MKAVYLFLLSAIVLGCATSHPVETNSVRDFSSLENGVLFSKRMVGFNVSNAFQYTNTNTPEFKELMSSVEPGILRFPGGTIGNFYHPDSGAYGFRAKETLWVDGQIGEHIRSLSGRYEGSEQNYLGRFIQLCLDLDCKAIYVVNILTGTPREFDVVMNQLKDAGVEVAGVELGNEMYLKGYNDSIGNVRNYIERCKPFVKHIRQHFPAIPIAAVGVPYSLFEKNTLAEWNNELAREDFYDAISLHIYPKLAEFDTYKSAKSYWEYASSELTNFTGHLFPLQLKKLDELFNHKKFWITEWNVLSAGTQIGNTLEQCFYITESLRATFRMEKYIDASCFHNMYGSDHAFSMCYTEKNKPEIIIRNAAYYAFALLAQLPADSLYIYDDIEIKNAEGVVVTPISTKGLDILYLLVVNKGAAEKEPALNLKWNQEDIIKTTLVQKTSLVGAALYSSPGKTILTKNPLTLEDSKEIEWAKNQFVFTSNDTSGLRIAPYSISLIEFNVTKP